MAAFNVSLRTLFRTAVRMNTTSTINGTSVFARPDLDFDYLLNSDNLDEIKANCHNRKGTGDIDAVHTLYDEINKFYLATSEEPAKMSKRDVRIKLETLWNKLYEKANAIPNRTSPSSPIGATESEAVLAGHVNLNCACRKDFKVRPAEVSLAKSKNLLHRKVVSAFHGTKAYTLQNQLSHLERCIVKYVKKRIVQDEGFTLLRVDDVLPIETPERCGLAQRTEKDIIYRLRTTGYAVDQLCLSGTGEMGIANLLACKVFDESQLPMKFCTVSRCYRPETAEGAMASGLYRVHEFTKVEMFMLTRDRQVESDAALQYLINTQKSIFEAFDLEFRVLSMPTGELGAAAYQKYDIETKMPSKDTFGEVSSASNCTDYQSRRLNIKYRSNGGTERYVHTLNGTAAAIPRLIIAIIEQNQNRNNTINIPKCLQDDFGQQILVPAVSAPKMIFDNQHYSRFKI